MTKLCEPFLGISMQKIRVIRELQRFLDLLSLYAISHVMQSSFHLAQVEVVERVGRKIRRMAQLIGRKRVER